MATTGPINGTSLLLYVDGTAIGGTTSHSLSLSEDLPDASHKDSGGWAENIHGQRNWSIDFDGFVQFDDAYSIEELYDLINNRSGDVYVVFSTKISGDVQFSGGAKLADLSVEASNEDTTTYSGTFTGNGALNKSNVT